MIESDGQVGKFDKRPFGRQNKYVFPPRKTVIKDRFVKRIVISGIITTRDTFPEFIIHILDNGPGRVLFFEQIAADYQKSDFVSAAIPMIFSKVSSMWRLLFSGSPKIPLNEEKGIPIWMSPHCTNRILLNVSSAFQKDYHCHGIILAMGNR